MSTGRDQGFRDKLRKSRTRLVLPLVILLALQAALVQSGCLDLVDGPVDVPPLPGQGGAQGELSRASANPEDARGARAQNPWEILPPRLKDPARMGGLEGLLSASDPHGAEPEPSSLGALLSRLSGPVETPALPEAPHGAHPVASAVQTYAQALSVQAPTTPEIRQIVDAWELGQEGERALARLVLTYVKALELQQQATQGTEPEEVQALLGRLVTTGGAQIDRAAGEDLSNDQAQALSDLENLVDLEKIVQASTLMAKGVDELRAPLDEAARTAYQRHQGHGGSPMAGDGGSLASGEGWTAALAILQTVTGQPLPNATIPEDLTLLQALDHLGSHYGLAPGEYEIDGEYPLPPSLDHAIALLIEAKAQGIEHRDPVTHALLMVKVTREAAPALEAWSGLLSMSARETGQTSSQARPDLAGLLQEARRAQPSPLEVFRAARGAPSAAGSPATDRSLDSLLTDVGLPQVEAEATTDALPSKVASGLAPILSGLDHLHQAQASFRTELTPGQQAAIADTPRIQMHLSDPSWEPETAREVDRWVQEIDSLPQEPIQELEHARQRALSEIERGIDELADLPQPARTGGLPGSPAATASTHTETLACPEALEPLGLSDCENDVWFHTQLAGGLLISGFDSSRIDARYGHTAPTLSVDLGGDDEYFIPVATAVTEDRNHPVEIRTESFGFEELKISAGTRAGTTVSPTTIGGVSAWTGPQFSGASVAVDLAGDDRYTSEAGYNQGTARGPGTLGMLWDQAGNDTYEHTAKRGGAQGYGALGGLGILIDGGGQDTYHAPRVFAQGVNSLGSATLSDAGQGTLHLQIDLPGGGLLIDGGSNTGDTFEARGGQGYTDTGGIALLVDRGGDTAYKTLRSNPAFQGGREDRTDTSLEVLAQAVGPFGAPAGFAGLLDLGGNDTYSNQAAPSGPRGNDRFWHDNGTAPLGIGVDTSLDDPDGDGSPSLVEVMAGSDPNDPEDTPVEGLRRTATGLVATLTDDDDGDGFPNLAENVTRTDPNDPNSTPASSGYLLEVRAPCGAPNGCNETASLLIVGGPGEDTYERPAVVQVDLGGSDLYTGETAGPANVTVATGGTRAATAEVTRSSESFIYGSLAVDVAGNDRRDTPGMERTQGATDQGASVLIDLGTGRGDVYKAASCSQGSACASDAAAGILLDLTGDDTYVGQAMAQGAASGGGLGALIDTDGGDTYRFATQGYAQGDGGVGLLYDLLGNDIYNSTALSIDPVEPTDAQLFAPQGTTNLRGSAVPGMEGEDAVAFPTPVAGREEQGLAAGAGIFWDVIGEDTYVSRTTDARHQDVSDEKNSRFETGAGTSPVDAHAFMDDIDRAQTEDRDGDGAINAIEAAFGTDPDNRTDNPGTFFEIWDRLRTGHWYGSDEGLTGERGGDAWFRAPHPGEGLYPEGASPSDQIGADLRLPGLLIGGMGASVHDEPIAFLVDLGGPDRYTAPGIGGAAFPHPMDPPIDLNTVGSRVERPAVDAALLMDLGDGDDRYAPEPAQRPASSRSSATFSTAVPSLGGAILGSSLLIDNGGTNTFRSSTDASLTTLSRNEPSTSASTFAFGVTQGAGLLGGVGMLATWDARNTFEASVNATAIEDDTDPNSHATSIGVAQGAGAAGGIGLLATFGNGADTYTSRTRTTADTGVDIALSQGAGSPWLAVPMPTIGVSLGGTGFLYDAGGDNAYEVQGGVAQGAALGDGGVGVLWSGAGHDTYLGDSVAQGSTDAGLQATTTTIPPAGPEPGRGTGATGPASHGFLLEAGGNDRYEITPSSQLGQAGARGGVGLLLDWEGDDTYEATHASFTQGSGTGSYGIGYLLEAGGHDRYHATNQTQGYGHSGGTGLLFDVNGWDTYRAESSPARAPGPGGYFLDASGQDTYEPGTLASCNGCTWNTATAPPGAGIDDDTVGGTLDTLATTALPDELTLEISRDPDGADEVTGPEDPVNHTVYLLAHPRTPEAVDRVTFLVDGQAVGQGTYIPSLDAYRYAWDTRPPTDNGSHQAFPDGSHQIKASAYVPPGGPSDSCTGPGTTTEATGCHQAPAGSPDAYNIESRTRLVLVDNPPLADARLIAPNGQTGISPSLNQTATLRIHVSPDATCPQDLGPSDCDASRPGGHLRLEAHGPGSTNRSLLASYANATTIDPLDVALNATDCQAGSCQAWIDGNYTIRLNVTDSAGLHVNRSTPFLVDGTPPSSRPALPNGWTGSDFLAGQGTLSIPWTIEDDGSGPKSIALFRAIDDRWALLTNVTTATTGYATAARDTEQFTLITSAVDRFGNRESPCRAEERPPCVQTKLASQGSDVSTRVDFTRPQLSDPSVSPLIVAPGQPAIFEANATDTTSGISEVTLRAGDGATARLHKAGDGRYSTGLSLQSPDEPSELTYGYTIQVTDRAGNTAITSGKGILDNLPPRIKNATVSYTDPRGLEAAEGASNGIAEVRLTVKDAGVDTVTLAPSQLAWDPTPCQRPQGSFEDGRWLCELPLPKEAKDATYQVPLSVKDQAGHVNTSAQVNITVNNQPLEANGLRVAEATHDTVVLAWNTTRSGIPTPGTSQVLYGKTPSVTRQTGLSEDRNATHRVVIEDLLPATRYYARAVSVSPSGVRNQSDLLAFETASSINISLPGFQKNTVVQGTMEIPSRLTTIREGGPIDVTVSIQDAANRSSPKLLGEHQVEEGNWTVPLDTRNVPDGTYRLILEGSRLGDITRTVSPVFHVDNTGAALIPTAPLPGARTADPSPRLQVLVLDPFSTTPPPTSGVNLTLDGTRLDASAYEASYLNQTNTTGRQLEIRLNRTLQDGHHDVELTLPDVAGNQGRTNWGFTVDTTGPQVLGTPRLTYGTGSAAQPGEAVRLSVNVTDAGGVGTVSIESADGTDRLDPTGPSTWTGSLLVPPDVPDGTYRVDIEATDQAGNTATLPGAILVPVDGTRPEHETIATTPTGYTTVRLDLEATEPVSLEIFGPRVPQPVVVDDAQAHHEVQVPGLKPNVAYTLIVRMIDEAGNTASTHVVARTDPDHEPPTAATGLEVTSPGEGVANLTWRPARDNAGVGGYLVERSTAGATQTFRVPGDRASFEDPEAPPGQNVTYTVTAEDIGGNRGHSVQDLVPILALPHLTNLTVTPEWGNADDPFTFQVTYRHPTGHRPDTIQIQVDNASTAMSPVDPGADCTRGCTYQAVTSLPATTFTGDGPTFQATATVEGHLATATPEVLPHITSGADGPAFGPMTALTRMLPGASVLLLLFLAGGAAILLKRRSTGGDQA